MAQYSISYEARFVGGNRKWNGVVRVSADDAERRVDGICVPVNTSNFNVGSFFFYGNGHQFCRTFGSPAQPFDEDYVKANLPIYYDRESLLVRGNSPERIFRGFYFHVSHDELKRLIAHPSPVLEIARSVSRVPGRKMRELVDCMKIHDINGARRRDFPKIAKDQFPRFPRWIIESAMEQRRYGAAQFYDPRIGVGVKNKSLVTSFV